MLVVDDAPIIELGFKALLAGHDGIDLDYAADAVSGFALFKSKAPDVAVIDIALRDSSGLNLAQKMLSDRDDVKTICLSMTDDPLVAGRAGALGAYAFFSKSGDPNLVLETILAFYRNNSAQASC
ncbi:response regulator transcription factor [Methylocystis sp. JAN1]|uniref:response regulator n=1 Tax=Methylocystis sp. JAN1 TaxID=3397211 RepID=UPI003FA2EF99